MTVNPLSPASGNGNGTAPGPTDTAAAAPANPLRVLRQYWRTFLFTGVLGALVGAGLWGVLLVNAPRYTTESQLQVTGGVRDAYGDLHDMGAMDQTRMEILAAFIKNQVIRLTSDEMLGDALKRPDVRDTPWFKGFVSATSGQADTRAALEDLRNSFDANQIRGSTLIQVTLSGTDKAGLPTVADGIVEVYLNKLRFDSDDMTRGVRLTFVEEKKRAEDLYNQLREQLEQFARENDLPNLENRGTRAQENHNLLTARQAELTLLLQGARGAYEGMAKAIQDRQVTYSPQEMAAVEADPAIAKRDEELRQLQEQRDVYLAQGFGERHRVVKQIDQRTLAVQQQRKTELDRLLREREQVRLEAAHQQVASYEAQLAGVQPQLDAARKRVRDLNVKIQEYRQIESKATAAAEQRDKADQVLNEIRVKSSRQDNIRVRRVQFAGAAELSFPTPFQIVPATAATMLLVVGAFVFTKESLDQRIKSPGQLRALGKLELLGVLPHATEDPQGPRGVEAVVRDHPEGLIAEAFRQVRTALMSSMDGRGHRTLMLVGAMPNGGVSTVVCNLAMSLACRERRVLVIDADLRRPSQHKLFGAPARPGLVDVLRGEATLADAVAHAADTSGAWSASGVDVMPVGGSGQSDPQMLESEAFRALLSQLRSQYDIVLVDAPPALVTSDAQVLARRVDAVAVVVRAGRDKHGMVTRAIRQLTGLRGEVLGVILNGARSSVGGYFRQNYKAFYRYRQNGSAKRGRRSARASHRIAPANVDVNVDARPDNGSGHEGEDGSKPDGR